MLTTHRMIKNKYEIKWFEKFDLLKEFKKEFNRFPKHKEIYKGINIGNWCHNQRKIYKGSLKGNLTQEKIDLLNSINFIWDVFDEQWLNNFELLKEFIDEFNRFPKYKETYKGVNIGGWCTAQRQVYKGSLKGNLTQEKIEMLNSINFIWDVFDSQWFNHFKLLKEFIDEFNRLPKDKEIYKGINIGGWCTAQRQAYKGNIPSKLNKEKIDLLKSIDFKWNIK